MGNSGIVTYVFNWFTHPLYSDNETLFDYGAFILLVLAASFLWYTVVKQIQA